MENKVNLDLEVNESGEISLDLIVTDQSKRTCFICLSDEGEEEGQEPLIRSCACEKELGWTHAHCIEEYMKNGSKECAICKKEYSHAVSINWYCLPWLLIYWVYYNSWCFLLYQTLTIPLEKTIASIAVFHSLVLAMLCGIPERLRFSIKTKSTIRVIPYQSNRAVKSSICHALCRIVIHAMWNVVLVILVWRIYSDPQRLNEAILQRVIYAGDVTSFWASLLHDLGLYMKSGVRFNTPYIGVYSCPLTDVRSYDNGSYVICR